MLHFAQYSKFCFQSFSLRYALKNTLKNTFSTCIRLHFLPPSFCFTIRFCSYESTKDKLSLYHIWTLVRLFAGVFCKSFLPPHYNWKVTSRLLGYFTKILQKFFRCNWFFADGNISVFGKNLKHPPYILDICIPVCGGVSQNFFKKLPTIIGNFKEKIGNFKEKSKWSTQNFSHKKLLSHYNWTLAKRNLMVCINFFSQKKFFSL